MQDPKRGTYVEEVVTTPPSQLQTPSCPAALLKQFDPSPGHQVMNKMRFFFQNFDCHLNFAKHMEFDDRMNQGLKMQIEKTMHNA